MLFVICYSPLRQPGFTRPRAQRLDALLDALGDFAFPLQRPQRVLRLLHHEVEARQLLADVIDHGALFAQHLEVDVDVVEQVGDGVGASLHLLHQPAARLDVGDLGVSVADASQQVFDLAAQVGDLGAVIGYKLQVRLAAAADLVDAFDLGLDGLDQ